MHQSMIALVKETVNFSVILHTSKRITNYDTSNCDLIYFSFGLVTKTCCLLFIVLECLDADADPFVLHFKLVLIGQK